MRLPVKLSSIDQEHLQELYNESGVARDELPYSEAFDKLVQGFQDRTFKNAHHEQVYAALLKHVRSSTNSSTEQLPIPLTEDQLKFIKMVVPRHAKGGKLVPYSDEFEAALKEFNKMANATLTQAEFWRTISRSASARKPIVRRAKVAAPVAEEDDADIDVE